MVGAKTVGPAPGPTGGFGLSSLNPFLTGDNIMRIPIYQVDVFTKHLFGGNPAAVCPLRAWLSDDVLQAIAQENNLSETAYFVPHGSAYHLRWFTPETEVDLCGHATLAAAHVLIHHLMYPHDRIEFHTQSGAVWVRREGDRLTLDFPSRPPEPTVAPPALVEALGGDPITVLRSRDHFVVYRSADEIAALRPDFARLSGLESLGVIVTAPGTDCDFVSRFFAPDCGIAEDPATGSAHCTLIPYWAGRLGRTELHARQLSARQGEFFCRLVDDRVAISGHAVSYLEGAITVADTA